MASQTSPSHAAAQSSVKRRPRRQHVCSEPGCPNLIPCPTHSRPEGESWGERRDSKAQDWFRRAVFARSSGWCERCKVKPATAAHHIRPGYAPECGIAVCDECHSAIDTKARKRR